jgi:isopentenyl diphosphate isomerase/L-lactate dehydrogenase-like FMN-dependent dehydrogenase
MSCVTGDVALVKKGDCWNRFPVNQCEARLPRFLDDHISGGSFQENSLRANIAELQATLLRQRVMMDESRFNSLLHLWDQALSLPVVLGPFGMAGTYSSRGEIKAALWRECLMFCV